HRPQPCLQPAQDCADLQRLIAAPPRKPRPRQPAGLLLLPRASLPCDMDILTISEGPAIDDSANTNQRSFLRWLAPISLLPRRPRSPTMAGRYRPIAAPCVTMPAALSRC